MSITKLQTIGNWQPSRWRDGAELEEQGRFRGRVITGMLTGGDPDPDEPAAQDPRAGRTP